jgi:hypothetical protein
MGLHWYTLSVSYSTIFFLLRADELSQLRLIVDLILHQLSCRSDLSINLLIPHQLRESFDLPLRPVHISQIFPPSSHDQHTLHAPG